MDAECYTRIHRDLCVLTFLVLRSKLCTDLVGSQDDGFGTACTIDQGGLVVIASAIFWGVAFVISVVYIKDPKRDLGIVDGEITNTFDRRQEERLQREKERRMKAQVNREQRRQHRQRKGQEKSQERDQQGVSISKDEIGEV